MIKINSTRLSRIHMTNTLMLKCIHTKSVFRHISSAFQHFSKEARNTLAVGQNSHSLIAAIEVDPCLLIQSLNNVFTAVLYSSTGFQQVKFKTFKDFFETIMLPKNKPKPSSA